MSAPIKRRYCFNDGCGAPLWSNDEVDRLRACIKAAVDAGQPMRRAVILPEPGTCSICYAIAWPRWAVEEDRAHILFGVGLSGWRDAEGRNEHGRNDVEVEWRGREAEAHSWEHMWPAGEPMHPIGSMFLDFDRRAEIEALARSPGAIAASYSSAISHAFALVDATATAEAVLARIYLLLGDQHAIETGFAGEYREAADLRVGHTWRDVPVFSIHDRYDEEGWPRAPFLDASESA